MEPGSLVLEDGTVLPPDPAETVLRPLYSIEERSSVRLSMIQASDRMAVGLDGTSRSLNGPEDHRILRVARSWADVVIVGAQTARVEGYGDIPMGPDFTEARLHDGMLWPPDLAIVTRNGRVPEGLDPLRTWIFTTEWGRAVNMKGPLAKRVIPVGKNEIDVFKIIGFLRMGGHRRILCEGGPALARLFLAQHAVSDYCLTTSPKPSSRGPKVPPVPERMQRAHALSGNGYVMERWEGLS
ncbi:MAG: dihydrofolate reductase family protein [Actinomycetota bacterium]